MEGLSTSRVFDEAGVGARITSTRRLCVPGSVANFYTIIRGLDPHVLAVWGRHPRLEQLNQPVAFAGTIHAFLLIVVRRIFLCGTLGHARHRQGACRFPLISAVAVIRGF